MITLHYLVVVGPWVARLHPEVEEKPSVAHRRLVAGVTPWAVHPLAVAIREAVRLWAVHPHPAVVMPWADHRLVAAIREAAQPWVAHPLAVALRLASVHQMAVVNPQALAHLTERVHRLALAHLQASVQREQPPKLTWPPQPWPLPRLRPSLHPPRVANRSGEWRRGKYRA